MRKNISGHITQLVLLIILPFLSGSCRKEKSADNTLRGNSHLNIRFAAVIDGDTLVTGKMYRNVFGEEYSVKTFKFYIHGIELHDSQTNTTVKLDKNAHYLINATSESGSLIVLNVPPASYNAINFVIGVDSIRNTSGAQTAALDPGQGMFWTWTTGYIMAKLEGNSHLAATPNQVIEYHIGGFKGNESVIRRVSLNFPRGLLANIKKGGQSSITITADINRWFSNPNPIRISTTPVIMTPGILATQIADNYAGMFNVVQISNE